METVANIFRSGTLGIIVTGMGDDGSKGMKYIKEVGGHTIVQSPETAAIDSMPKAVINHGAADEILNIEDIVKRIIELIPEN